ncbi:S-adenosylmethionine-dependent methyltransferase [Vermiconidia calcicola]|uniref:S-adenosylmethionine-dependent methyltransferase n=1 Tax=Vermiconidia calcicola TaxID=1690605 RepID=A0ACC3MNY3_9PEZI|nr:S-adenosylmethionine-dependent methyltransferase [Vermiconidia calcicola]
MLPTPSTSHVNYEHIYEPSEDSYLLLDTLASPTETAFLRSQFPAGSPSPLVLEVGTGSGVVLAFATAHAEHIFGRSDIFTLGIDVNPFACEATQQTVVLAVKDAQKAQQACGVLLDGVCSDLTAAVRPGAVDVILFNPPYVPTAKLPLPPEMNGGGAPRTSFERDHYLSSLATDGGVDDRSRSWILSEAGLLHMMGVESGSLSKSARAERKQGGRSSASFAYGVLERSVEAVVDLSSAFRS